MDYERVLVQLGFTPSQADVYLALLKTGQATARTLAAHSKVPRPAIYRALQELQQMGLVEKVLAAPSMYRAAPFDEGIAAYIKRKMENFRMLEVQLKELLQHSEHADASLQQKEPRLILIHGKERIIRQYSGSHDSARESVDVISSWQRWLQILHHCGENYRQALARGVKYRVIIDQPVDEASFLGKVCALLAYPNFTLGVAGGCVEVNMAVFDGAEANLSFHAARMLEESPVISTNHPGLIAMFKSHFEAHWKQARKIEAKSPGKN